MDDAEKPVKTAEQVAALSKVYGVGEEGRKEWEYAQKMVETINADLELREQPSDVFNGIPYSEAYEYNRRKAINYSPPRNPNDDREVSFGLVHEKVVTFVAMLLKYAWKRRVRSFDKKGRLIRGLGDVLDLAIEHSYRLDKMVRKMVPILWEAIAQGNCFVMEDWQVRLIPRKKAFMVKNGQRVEVNPDEMDYTFEFLEGLTYQDDGEYQERKASCVRLDGRQVIFGDPEIEEVQEQERITIEISFPRSLAEQLFGSLKRWEHVPKNRADLTMMIGEETTTLFDTKRLKDPGEVVIAHLVHEKYKNRYNLFLNGVMMLPRETTFDLFYPRRNYPLSNVASERLSGSIYARSLPAKVKFTADFMDWALKGLAEAFEQGLFPSILAKGKYTLSRDMFRAGRVTHGVKKDDYEFANPDRAQSGIKSSEFSFVNLLKEVFEAQTASGTSSGEVSEQATATAIAKAEAGQMDKLGYLLDGVTIGMMDIASRRLETIESKYTLKERKTIVDGKEVDVYQNFTVQAYGFENHVIMDTEIGNQTPEKKRETQDLLFQGAFEQKKKKGISTRFFMANPEFIRKREFTNDVEILSEMKKQTQLQMIQFWDEVRNLKELFPNVNNEKLQEEYLEVSGRPDDLFNSADMMRLEQEKAAMAGGQEVGNKPNLGGFGQPTVKPNAAAMSARR